MPNIKFNNGIDKPRGLENAALQHLKHQNPEPTTGQKNSSFDPYLAATVELGKSQAASGTTYSPPVTPVLTDSPAKSGEDNGNDLLLIGNGVKLNLNTTVEVDNSNDVMIIGNGAKVNWSSTVGTDNGNDTVIIGNGAKVEFSGTTGVDNGDDTLIIGNGAKVKINSVTGTGNGSGTLIIGEGADVEITGSVSVDSSKGGITYLNGKVHIHLMDEANQSFTMELKVKDKEEAESIQEFLRDKIKNKKLQFADFLNTIREAREHVKETKVHKNIELAQLKRQEESKPINKHQVQLEMFQSLIQNLFKYQLQVNQGLHRGFNRTVDRRV